MLINTIFSPSNLLLTNNTYREGISKNSENIYLMNKKQQTNIVLLDYVIEDQLYKPIKYTNSVYNGLYYDPTYIPANFEKYLFKINRSIRFDINLYFELLPTAITYPGVLNLNFVLVMENFISQGPPTYNINTLPAKNYFFNTITDIVDFQGFAFSNKIFGVYENGYVSEYTQYTFSLYLIDDLTPAQKTWIDTYLSTKLIGFIRQF